MTKLPFQRPGGAAAALMLALAAPIASAADASGEPAHNFGEYYRDTSVPQVPAATLLGVDKSKIVEVSSVSKLSTTLSSARTASSAGTPFGVDIAPFLVLGNASGPIGAAIGKDRYASDPWVRLMAHTRLSFARAQDGNSTMSAWGIYTRPIDLRDPFVDPGLERCFRSFQEGYLKLKKARLPAMPALIPDTLSVDDSLAVLNNIVDDPNNYAIYAALRTELANARRPIAKEQIQTWNARLASDYQSAARQVDAEINAELMPIYGPCAKPALDQLANRSYLALGYSHGSARATDNSLPVDLRPGEAWWMTFVYGFEGLGNVFGGEASWKETGKSTAAPLGSARVTLHVARNLKSSKTVSGAEQSTAGTLLGLGFDYALMDSHRASVQVTRSRIGEGTTRSFERRAVLGLDFRIQDGLWFGLSWGRLNSTLGGQQNEAKAAIKWAFSDKSWYQ
jgi:hypothetical protein